MLSDNSEHLGRSEILETRPAEILVRPLPVILASGKDPPLQCPLESGSLQFLQGVQVVQALEKKQIGNLLDDFERLEMPPDQKASQMRST
jgi:hypothetical protein